MTASKPALLALADGSIFHGISIGIDGQTTGEVVFNTAMTGYQEILTDPSYREQIITLTYPHIGNVGTNAEDGESDKVQLAGLVLREVPRRHSSFRSTQDFSEYLKAQKVVAIAVVAEGCKLQVKSGARAMTLSWKELEDYLGARASRGSLLPRGWQKVDALASE